LKNIIMTTMQNIKGADHELSFWKQFVQSDRFINGWLSNAKTPELNDLVYMFLLGQPSAKVLDCGSGVVSILHGTVKRGNLHSYDLLGDEYEKIFDYKKIGIDLKPIAIGCEDINTVDFYDVVHISNALDHTQDPQAAYNAMYRAVKPGGFLIIQGFVNEGTHEEWTGFHQYNIDIKELITYGVEYTALVIESKNGDAVVYAIPYFARKIHIEMLNRDWIVWITRKPLEA